MKIVRRPAGASDCPDCFRGPGSESGQSPVEDEDCPPSDAAGPSAQIVQMKNYYHFFF